MPMLTSSIELMAGELIEELRAADALTHTVVVVADAAQPVSIRYLAAYGAATIAEWFAYRGRAALVVYDDLTRHAEAYRDLSLLLRRPPSREAYPGDILYTHARHQARAFKLRADRGGGSVTALPILETQRGDFAGFIPINLISITDGQLYLDARLLVGQVPAVDVGRSVSRVGGSAQLGCMRAANLRLDLAQYADVRGFARSGPCSTPRYNASSTAASACRSCSANRSGNQYRSRSKSWNSGRSGPACSTH
jgi:F-type H+-transporting ATPase subunit alpha